MEARREAISERLQTREAMRKKSDKHFIESEKTEHDIDRFGIEFSLCKARFESLLDSSDENDAAVYLETLKLELQTAQKLVSGAQLYLPDYIKQTANRTLTNLATAFDEHRDKLAPKKKFTFRGSRKKETNLASGDDDVNQRQKQAEVITDATSECDYRDLNSVTLVKRADAVSGKDISLHRLTNSRVEIQGSPSTVHICKLKDCTVLLGPVATSVFVDDCCQLTLAVACQQLRIHATIDSHFYVQVSSRSVIEDSRRLYFAPYTWEYEGIDDHYTVAGFERRERGDRWNAVDDFDWLVAGEPSPNWAPIDVKDRVNFCGNF